MKEQRKTRKCPPICQSRFAALCCKSLRYSPLSKWIYAKPSQIQLVLTAIYVCDVLFRYIHLSFISFCIRLCPVWLASLKQQRFKSQSQTVPTISLKNILTITYRQIRCILLSFYKRDVITHLPQNKCQIQISYFPFLLR